MSATRATRTVTRLAAAVALLASATPALVQAQSIALRLGSSASDTLRIVKPADKFGIDFISTITGTTNLASLGGSLRWPGALAGVPVVLDSVVSNSGTLIQTFNSLVGFSSGSASAGLSYFGTSGLSAGERRLSTAWFTAASLQPNGNYASTRVNYASTSAAAENGTSVLGSVTAQPIDVCVVASSLLWTWGDVNNDGSVTIADAQQVARHSVSLTVADAAAMAARGDVNNDGSVNITDAQQIARFTVGLSASARINTTSFTAPRVDEAELTGAATIPVGDSTAVTPVLRRVEGGVRDTVTYCGVPLTYESSNPSVATVSRAGLVTGVGAGTANITVRSGTTVSSHVVITVNAPATLSLNTPFRFTGALLEDTTSTLLVRGTGGSDTLKVTVSNATPQRVITASIASGTGTLGGTLTATTSATTGVAIFPNLSINGTGKHILRFSAPGLAAVLTDTINVINPTAMRLLVGQHAAAEFPVGSNYEIPLVLDLVGRGSGDLSSINTRVSWNPAQFTYVANAAGTWVDDAGNAATVVVNTDSTAQGILRVTGFTIGATTQTGRILRTLTLRAAAASATPLTVSATVLSSANAAGTSVTVNHRNLTGLTTAGTGVAPVASVTVAPPTGSLTVGGTQQLTATLRDASSNPLTGRTVTWNSNNTAVATVSASGLVTALSAGTATITASSEGASGSATITVSAPAVPVATVTLAPATASLTVGGTQQLTPTLRDASNNVLSGRTVTYSPSNAAVATVSASGLVTAVAAGTATITATSEGITGTATITVTTASPLGTGFGADQFSTVAAGTFTMGTLGGAENEMPTGGAPLPVMTISQAFAMQKTEVTLRQWQTVMGTPWTNPGAAGCTALDCPVSGATYGEVQAFIAALNALPGNSGMNYRLPTETQWEYAARAGTTGSYGGTGVLDAMGWFSGNTTSARTVGGKAANAFGLYDMHGNVDEWVSDWLGFYPTGNVTDYTGPSTGTARILRGGSWGSTASNARSAFRYWVGASDRPVSGGFRLVRNP